MPEPSTLPRGTKTQSFTDVAQALRNAANSGRKAFQPLPSGRKADMPIKITLSGSADPKEVTTEGDHAEIVDDINVARNQGDGFYSVVDSQTGKRVAIQLDRITGIVEV